MGMDVYGKKPSNDAGEYFRRSVWVWRLLAAYVETVAPSIVAGCKHWHSNDGDGLKASGAKALAAKLREEVAVGRTAKYVAERDALTVEDVEEFATFLESCGALQSPAQFCDLLKSLGCADYTPRTA